MSVSIRHITKFYGKQKALDDVSFEAMPGRVTGFLGPNGAGKSTMMKIITCFIPQTTGEVKVCGFDLIEQPLEVKKRVGYLPEHNPLYHDMYVKEYLDFIARLHHLGSARSTRITEMIEITGLGPEQHKKIGMLSKGYRQRVGLAQALLHHPEVLILDEPTSGLDPNQLSDIRTLIRNISREKTVILSTHIMQEVEAICEHVIIIHKGKIVADEDTGVLREEVSGGEQVLVEFDKPVTRSQLSEINGVVRAEYDSGNTWILYSEKGTDIREAVFRFAVREQRTVLSLQKRGLKLEDIFQRLTHGTS
ncbi:MAG: gliding motility-associated ABC transporter ATP-binding subunit GldA [Bacteroidia bacterium]|nr:gliding motility-associated ABC transporter ATP-binding subunit GldA [Bacteroidia bacterium]